VVPGLNSVGGSRTTFSPGKMAFSVALRWGGGAQSVSGSWGLGKCRK
jgi:hypothetical protein